MLLPSATTYCLFLGLFGLILSYLGPSLASCGVLRHAGLSARAPAVLKTGGADAGLSARAPAAGGDGENNDDAGLTARAPVEGVGNILVIFWVIFS